MNFQLIYRSLITLTFRKLWKVFIGVLIILGPSVALGINSDIGNNLEVLDIYNQKIKQDSTIIAFTLDSAKNSFENRMFLEAINFAEKVLMLSIKDPESIYTVQSELLLARSYEKLYFLTNSQYRFNNTIKFYLKAITSLEFTGSAELLAKVYVEYGDFYSKLDLNYLTIKNYTKAFELIENGNDYSFQQSILDTIATLNVQLKNYELSISSYLKKCALQKKIGNEEGFIEDSKKLCQLYTIIKDYDNAISTGKELYEYYKLKGDFQNQITYQSLIGEISYEATNRDQADKAFKSYFSLVDKHENYLKSEIASLRYINNLIKEGDLYKWHLENGYWSDYQTAIRYYNKAQRLADTEQHPHIASVILNRTGTMYFMQKDYKTCITYFNLALYFANRTDDLQLISDSHIMLARSYAAIERWDQATNHYELHGAYNDSIIQKVEVERVSLLETSIDSKKETMLIEQTLDQIEAQERQELTLAQKELINIALGKEVALIKQDLELKEILIQNKQMVEDSVLRNYLLTREKLANVENAKKIEDLNFERETQDWKLKNLAAKREIEQAQIKILEQENNLAKSRQAYYVLSIIFISLFLVFILIIYLQKRKANHKLKLQNQQIETQSKKLEQAYKNLELLSTIGRDITSSLIIEEIIETIYENLNSLMDAAVLGIGVYEKDNHQLHFPGVREQNQRLVDIYIDLEDENKLATYCFNHQKEIIISNFYASYEDFIHPEILPVVGDGNSTSIVYIPLTIGDKKLGVLTVQSFDENAFNKYHINIIRNIAIYAKIALENANVYRELEQQSVNLKIANTNIGAQNKLIEKQNQQLLSINEEKNVLIKILAHDLRNPLATAMSMTELVRFEKNNLSAEQYQASEIIWRGLNRMNDMISSILDIKAIEAQQVNLNFEVINPIELFDPLEKLFEAKAEAKRITLHFSNEAGEPYIKVDQNYMIQVMENLISNALKFSPPNRNIYIVVRLREGMVWISVRDEGPGIPKHEFSNLFKKFQKLSPRPTAGESSIGLGLSIVKKYVEVMNGRVWCESKSGSGSEFIVEFQNEPVLVS